MIQARFNGTKFNKGLARITKIDAPPYPKVAQFLRSCHNAGGSSTEPAETALMS